jgi:hypothetical protein
MTLKWRMVRQFGAGVDPASPYRVESVACLTQKEALQLLRDLGSPYNGQVEDNHPTPRKAVRGDDNQNFMFPEEKQ